MYQRRRKMARLAVETLATAAALALLTWTGVRLGLRAEPAAVLYLGLILLVSLRGNIWVALFAAIVGTAAWDYFFSGEQLALPQRQFRDIVTLVVFSATAFMITRLVTALRASEGRWRNVFDNNPTMYFMVDTSGTVLSVNPTGAEQLGYRPDELVGQPVLGVFLEEDKAAARDHVGRCLAHLGESMSWELRKVRKNGTMLWVRETARAVQLGTDAPVVLIACEDITDQKAAQDKLRENEARLRGQASLLDLTHDAIFVRDFASVITYWNRGAEQLYGWSKEEALGRVTHELLRTEFPEPVEQIMSAVLRSGRWDGELVHTKRDGARVIMASRWSLQRNEQGTPIGVLETNNDISVRKRAEEELRRSESFLAQAQRLSHTGSFGWRPADGTISWSDETYEIFGVDRDAVPTVELALQQTHPDDRTALKTGIEQAEQAGKDFELAHRLLMPDGSVKHLRIVAHTVADESGLPEFVGAIMDVTEQKLAEEDRRSHLWFLESMDRVNRAMQGANDVEQMTKDVLEVVLSIFDCDEVSLTYPCDPDASSYRVVMRATRPELLDVDAQNLVEFPIDDGSARLMQTARESGRPVRFDPSSEHGALTPSTKRFGVQSGLAMALHPKVDAPYTFWLHQMSHARVWTQQEDRLFQEIGRRLADALTTLLVVRDLRESERRYRNIFQMAEVSIWEEDFSRVKAAIEDLKAQGISDFGRYFAEHPDFVGQAAQLVRIVDVNDATVRLFGAGSKEELLVSLDRVFTPETVEVFAGELRAVAERRTSFAAETVLQTLGGERLDVIFTIALPQESPTLDRVLVSIMDVTARKQAEEALRTAQAELARASTLTTLGQLAASIAHELRQPLAAMAMNGSATLRWLNREIPDLPEAREAAARIVREAHRADEVIRGLRALVSKSGLQREPLDINEAIHEVLELARGELRRSDVVVQADLDPVLPTVLGDRVQLQQVILNLVVNAIEAMIPVADRAKLLVIRTERPTSGGVAITVEDSGPGLDPATAARIFDPFFTTKANGLGIGLSICRSIIEAHGGELRASPRPAGGTTFRFTVPMSADAPSTAPLADVQHARGEPATDGLATA